MGFRNGSPTDCAEPKATYALAAKGGPRATCPDGNRDDSVYEVYTNESLTLCFALNAIQGHCHMKMDDGKATLLTPVDCDDTRFAQVKVDARVDGSTDSSQCPPGATSLAYPTPPRSYCLVRAGA